MAREGAPNIVLVVVDDLGFADVSPYGSEIATPNIQALADRGVSLANYHTAPVCSPARAAMLTGLNPHRAGFANVAGFDPGFPNYTLELGDDVVTLPEALRASGYATYAIGKWHLSREDLLADGAARDSWPLQRGFDRYYGCLEGFTSYFAPNRMTRDNSPVAVDAYPDDYYLTDDLTDEAVSMIHSLRAHDADKPFFLYFAHHAVHAPLAARAEGIARQKGRYDGGWDALRKERFERQRELGLFGPEAKLPPRNHEMARYTVGPWDELDADAQALAARHMEVYAAMIDSIDQSIGRVLETIDAHGELDNTIVVFTSDNGGSAEGGAGGTRSYLGQFIFNLDLPGDWPRDVELDTAEIGGPRSMAHYPRGWAAASNTPYRLYKGTTFAGGVRTPCVVSWPEGLGGAQGLRSQYVYVTDLMPTLLEAAGLSAPTMRNGLTAKERDGVSALSVLRSAEADPTRSEQYSEYGGNRGYYADGWKLLTLHQPGPTFEDTEWQLFDVSNDPTESTDVAAQRPELVRNLAARWEEAAWANTVFPLNDASGALQYQERPERERWSQPIRLFPGTPTMERTRCIDLVRLRTVEFEALVEINPGDSGVLLAHGDQGGGYVLYVDQGQVRIDYNEYGRMHSFDGPMLPPGRSSVLLKLIAEADFRWSVVLTVTPDDGESVSVSSDRTVFMMLGLAPFSGIDIGADRGGPVSWDLRERHGIFAFSGRLYHVDVRPGEPASYDPAALFRAENAVANLYD